VLVPVVSALVGGAAGGGIVYALLTHGSHAPHVVASAEAHTASIDGSAGNSDEVDARLARLERRSAAAQALGEAARAMQARGAGGAGPFVPGDVKADNPVFELAVRSVLDKVEWEKSEERKVEQQNQRVERVQHMSDYLAQKLSLSNDQKSNVQQIFSDSMDAFRNLRDPPDGGRAPQSRDEWRQAMDSIRTQADQKMASVLTPAQMQSYQALQQNDDEVRSWRRPPGRGGR
jgi:enoyl-CoA hydratase/carnithine racemase